MKKALLLLSLFCLTSCAGPIQHLQPRVNNLIVSRHFDTALKILGDNPTNYGPKNTLLYWLDRGMVLHLAGRYRDSIDAFEKAKKKFDDLYTQSIHEIASSFLINDYRKSYRGDDEEYVLLNIFQALNFAALGEIHESLVEARDVDSKLKLINDRYGSRNENVYRDDAFARLLMGILYQADHSSDDARISFERASDVYRNDYQKNYGIIEPAIIKLVQSSPPSSKAQVFLIQYAGFMPMKVEDTFIVPTGDALLTRFSIPKYIDRPSALTNSKFVAHGQWVDTVYPTDIGEDIGSIAKQILENRKGLILAQAAIRPAAKLAAEKVVDYQLRKEYGDVSANAFDILSTVYNLWSEQADLRSWQTLPGQIRIARVALDPGQYQFYVESFDSQQNQIEKQDLGSFNVIAGDVKFLIVRSYL